MTVSFFTFRRILESSLTKRISQTTFEIMIVKKKSKEEEEIYKRLDMKIEKQLLLLLEAEIYLLYNRSQEPND